MSNSSEDTPTFSDLLDAEGYLHDAEGAEELKDMLLRKVFREEPAREITDVYLTSVEMKDHMVERRARRGEWLCARIKAEIGFQTFWAPMDSPLPAVRFEFEEGAIGDYWEMLVHPRLVAAGREEVMRGITEWLYHEILDDTAKLAEQLRCLSLLRRTEALTASSAKNTESPDDLFWKLGRLLDGGKDTLDGAPEVS